MNKILWKTKVILILCLPILILYSWLEFEKYADKQYSIKCREERSLFFEGVISEYKTDVLAERSFFCLNDSILITIPRNIKEIYLDDHDTIIKLRDKNLYIVKRYYRNSVRYRLVDTFAFPDCP